MKIAGQLAVQEIWRLFQSFDGRLPANQLDVWKNIEDFVSSLVVSGWSRKEVYQLVRNVEINHSNEMSEECADAIGNYITALVGDVALNCIVRLPGEKGSVDEHACYVRSQKWLLE